MCVECYRGCADCVTSSRCGGWEVGGRGVLVDGRGLIAGSVGVVGELWGCDRSVWRLEAVAEGREGAWYLEDARNAGAFKAQK